MPVPEGKQILVCWEIGGGLGHWYRILPLATRLRAHGFQVTVASRDPAGAAALLGPLGIPAAAAPGPPPLPGRQPLSLNYAQNLRRNGHGDLPWLKASLAGWLELFAAIRPHLVLAEHAPTALLAAQAARLPRVAVGTGFSLPPLASPMPSLHPWLSIPGQALAGAERQWLDGVNPALAPHGVKLESAADLFRGARTCLCAFPEFDHYGARAGGAHLGPVLHGPASGTVSWPGSRGGCFVYLGAGHPALARILETLERLRVPTLAHVRGPGDHPAARTSRHVRISAQPADLAAVARNCAFAITHAGANTACRLLLEGVPLLLAPVALEQTVLAYRLQAQGLARMMNPFDPRPAWEQAIAGLAEAGTLARSAQAFQRRHAAFDRQAPAAAVLRACREPEACPC